MAGCCHRKIHVIINVLEVNMRVGKRTGKGLHIRLSKSLLLEIIQFSFQWVPNAVTDSA